MRIGIIGAGHIGGNCAVQLAAGGHEVMLSFSRNRRGLYDLAATIGEGAIVGEPAEAARFGDVVILAVPWPVLDEAIAASGGLADRIVVDTTNRFGDDGGRTSARDVADRLPGARYVKSFNTLTAAFQRRSAGRPEATRVVQWVAGDDADAKQTVLGLVFDAGYVGVDMGGVDDSGPMEAPRRPGAVYGEEYRLPEALTAVAALRAGDPLPPTPSYTTDN